MSALLKYLPLSPASAGTIAVLTLQRPERANAFNEQMMQSITQHLTAIKGRADCRALVVNAAGKHFSAGADLDWMRASATLTESENRRDAGLLSAMFEALAQLPIPTVAYVRGSAYGGAVGLVACCDITVAEDNARFCLSEVKLGLLPAVILPYLGRRMLPGQLQRLALTGLVFHATEAQAYGLIDQVTVADHGAETLTKCLNDLLSGSPEAQRSFKQLFQHLRQDNFPQNEKTVEAISRLRAGESGQTGLAAFFDKQPAPWVATISNVWS